MLNPAFRTPRALRRASTFLLASSLLACHAPAEQSPPDDKPDAPTPSLQLQAEPPSAVLGSAFTLSWATQHLQSCLASEAWSGTRPLIGSETVQPTATGKHVYELSCSDGDLIIRQTATITVIEAPPEPVSANLTVAPALAGLNQPVAVQWLSSGASGCEASGAWSGTLPPAGSRSLLFDAAGDYELHLRCEGRGGFAEHQQTLRVLPAPTLSLTASPSQGDAPLNLQLSWVSSHAQECTATDDWNGSRPLNGSADEQLIEPGTYRYTLSCSGLSGSQVQTRTITVLDPTAQAKALFESRRRIRDAAMP